MKDKINQVVVGNDMQHPLDCTIVSVFRSKDTTKGKVVVEGKKHPVTLLGGGVWVLTDGTTTHQQTKRVA